MKLKKIAFISLNAGSPGVAQALPQELTALDRYEVEFLPVDGQLVPKLTSTQHDVIVFDCPLFGRDELKIFVNVSRLNPRAHLLVLAEQISLHCYREIGSLKNTITLQKPLQAPLLKGLLDRVATGEDVKPSSSPRFIIDENVRILAMKTGLLISTRMRNYSASGAFLEYHGIALNIGDEIKFTLMRPDSTEEALDLQAKVVWIRDGEHSRSATRGIGIQFLAA